MISYHKHHKESVFIKSNNNYLHIFIPPPSTTYPHVHKEIHIPPVYHRPLEYALHLVNYRYSFFLWIPPPPPHNPRPLTWWCLFLKTVPNIRWYVQRSLQSYVLSTAVWTRTIILSTLLIFPHFSEGGGGGGAGGCFCHWKTIAFDGAESGSTAHRSAVSGPPISQTSRLLS